MAPKIIFGTATFGMTPSNFQDVDSVKNVLNILERHNVTYLDTAARYPPGRSGYSEQLIGEASSISHRFTIDTKVTVIANPDGTLTPKAVETSVSQSFARLQLDAVNVLYAHTADPATPVSEQVAAFNAQIESGKCKEYGISNHSVQQVEAMLQACEERGLRKPTVYQGDYNMVTRGMESELLPLLRKHGMRFMAFRPLAGGFLTGNMVSGTTEGTRMGNDSPMGPLYQKLYGSPVLQNTMKKFQAALEEFQLSSIEVSLRWLYHHSALGSDDGIIIGASKISQLEQNLQYLEKGELPSAVVEVVEDVWQALQESRGTIL